MKTRRYTALLGSVGLIGLTTPAFAQSDGRPPSQAAASTSQVNQDEETTVTVTGSRIERRGFESATPLTVVGPTEIRLIGQTEISTVLADLPQFRATNSATSSNTSTGSGTTSADLRGLGSSRTLVLLNNRRYIGAGVGIFTDLNTIPFSLIKRVDVVTGGASAAYGSGAVSGVVNFILDDQKKGLEIGAQAGVSSQGDGGRYYVDASYGVRFADDRGHFMAAIDYLKDSGITPSVSRPLVGGTAFFPTLNNGAVQLTLAQDVREANRSLGGLILTGPFAGGTFNPDGSVRPFQFGTVSIARSQMIGGEGYQFGQDQSLSAPLERFTAFARATFDVSDRLKIWAEGAFNRVSDNRVFFPDLSINQLTFSVQNPFLPDQVRQVYTATGQRTITIGRVARDFALNRFIYDRENYQGSVGIEGRLGSWRYNGFYAHGETVDNETLTNLVLAREFANATDAVANPAGGAPICRIALTDPTTACRPLNLFGEGRASAEAISYVTANWGLRSRAYLDNAGVNVSGDLFTLWGKPVSLAFGGEWRREQYSSLYNDAARAQRFRLINGLDRTRTGFSVKEGYVELVAPLLVGLPGFKELSVNAAGRVSDYSTKGTIWSWKVGLTDQVFDGLMLRFTRSRDIRAGSLDELFRARTTNVVAIIDRTPPRQSDSNPTVTVFTGGNPDLAPEISNTLTVGAVATPSFIPGLSLSVDYYDIDIQNAITTLGTQAIVDRCQIGNDQNACATITRDATGRISFVNATFINAAFLKTRGVDLELAYRLDLSRINSRWGGVVRFRGLANIVDQMLVNDGSTLINYRGYTGPGGTSVPKWRATGTISYEGNPFGADLRGRYFPPSEQFNPATIGFPITNNHVTGKFYTDLTLRARVKTTTGPSFEIFGSVQNLFDVDPPISPAGTIYYDIVGRYFNFGARIRF